MRLSHEKKISLAKRIAQSVVIELVPDGHNVKLEKLDCTVCMGQVDRLGFCYTTPFSRLPGARAPYGLDVWFDFKKVYSFWWDPPQIVRFNYGPWMNLIVENSYPAVSEISALLRRHDWLIPHVYEVIRDLKAEENRT